MAGGEIISQPPKLPAERLSRTPTEQFYDWERRGRGWRVWEESAYLEPPFRPFFHLPVNLTPPVDDGRRHTWASLLIEKVQDWMTGKRATPAPEPIEAGLLALLEEPEIPPYEDEEGLIELQVALPPTAKVTNDTFAAFLLSLAYCSHPLAFEVIGTSEAITVQLVCRESDAAPVKEQLRAHFPEARVTGAQTYLGDLWLENHEAPAVVVEFGLSEEFMLPLKTLPEARDPLVAITGALSQLREGEIGVLQVLFESVRHPWAESVFRAVTNWDGKAFFANAPEMVGWAKEKIRSPLYAAVVRVAAKSEEEERAWQIAKALGGGLAYLDHPHVNELIPLDNEGYDPVEHQVDLILRLTHRGGMLLNADELVSLVHLPTAAVKTPKLKRQVGKTKPAPKIVLGHSTLLGENPHEGQTMPVGLSADQRVKHTYVIGAPGTGKSTFFLNLALQDIQAGNGLAVLDPHGDLIDQILERIPEQRLKDVILLDPSDAEFPIGFNILSAHSEIEKHLLSSDLVGVFKRLSTSWGDQMTSVLGNAILAFLESERGGTLADLRRFLVGKKDREEFLQTVKDQEIRYYWQKEFPMLTGGKSLGPLLTRLDTFLRPKLIRHMVGQKENKLDFADIMNSGKIFLAKLSQGAIGEENAYLLGSLLVSKFHQLTLARQEQREADRRPFYLYVDEFHNFVTPSMASILSGARKYRLGLILAHQELRQLKNEEVASAVLANPYTRVCFRLGDQDAKKLAEGFSFFEAKDLQNLGTGEAICRVERAEYDFNLVTPPLAAVNEQAASERREEIVRLSRERYGTKREIVEAELLKNAPMETGEDDAAETGRTKRTARREEGEKETPAATPHVMPAESAPSTVPSVSSPVPASLPTFEEAVQSRAEQGVPEPPVQEKPKTSSPPAIPPPLGRGGAAHKALQQKIALWAQGMGWRAVIEKEIPEGAGSVDVALEKGAVSIACEISITTGVDQEVGNIEKCLGLGYTHIAMIAQEQTHLAKIRRAALEKLGDKAIALVRFVTPETFFTFMEELSAQSASTEATVKGYKVKKKFDSGAQDTLEDVSRKVARGLKKLKGDQE